MLWDLTFQQPALLIDNPSLFKELPEGYNRDSVKSDYGKDLLMYAAHMNHYDAVKALLEMGWNSKAITAKEYHEYHCGSKMERLNRSALTYAVENASIHVIKLLLKAGSDSLIQDTQGNTLDYYLNKNPRFTREEKALGFKEFIAAYGEVGQPKPSFGCKGKLSSIEQAICDSPTLSIYDKEVAVEYKKLRSKEQVKDSIRSSQIKWIKKRNKDCKAIKDQKRLKACVSISTRGRLRYLEKLNKQLDEFHLLKHPFYIAWNNGELNQEILKDYAEQYYQHIKAFPRYISATHSICEDIENRKILLDNLSDEEDFNKDHPMLWKQFALAVGADKNSVETVEHEHFTKEMIDNFFRLSRSTYAEGLGALYAYERQVPEIADTKIKGLVDHYDVSSDEGLEYFVVHKDADVEHREQSAELMNKLSDEEKLLAKEAGLSTVKVLWGFLSGLCEKHNIQA